MRRWALRTALFVATVCGTQSAAAEIQKTLQLESEPSGARVYLLRGAQRVPLGVTPLDYAAEFHSEISVLRILFERPAFTPRTLEVSAKDDRVVARLESRSLVADPAAHRDEQTRRLQEKLNPMLKETLPTLLALRPELGADIADVVWVRRLSGALYLQVPLSVKTLGEKNREAGTSPEPRLARQIWDSLGKEVAAGIRSRLPAGSGLSGIVIESQLDAVAMQFAVGSHMQTSVEMQCVGGYRQEFRQDSCASYNRGNCVAGVKQFAVYEPCQTRIPVTKTEVKVNPTANTTRTRFRAYMVNMIDAPADSVSLAQTDPSGKIVFREGSLPDGLVDDASKP